jgi:retinol dehydrogenase 12
MSFMQFLKSNFNLQPNPYNFSPSTSIPPLTNKVILVTGGNSGIGLHTVLQLSEHSPAKIYLAARSQAKFDAALKEVLAANPSAKDIIHFLQLDLGTFENVKTAATKILDENERLDILVNNAGIMGQPHATTKDGYEITFATNYLSHCLLTELLLPLLQKTASREDVERGSVRIVNVSSAAYGLAPAYKGEDGSGLDVRDETQKSERKDVHPNVLYSISKLAQVWWAKEAAREWGGDLDSPVENEGKGLVMSVSLHPGRIKNTGILKDFFARNEGWDLRKIVQKIFDSLVPDVSNAEGAYTQVWAATAPMQRREAKGEKVVGKGVVNGGYYMPIGIRWEDKTFGNDTASRRLWEWTEKEVKKHTGASKL